MNKHNLRTKLALKIAPWLKPGEPRAREWSVSGLTPEFRIGLEADRLARQTIDRCQAIAEREFSSFNAPSEVTWKGSWADRVTR